MDTHYIKFNVQAKLSKTDINKQISEMDFEYSLLVKTNYIKLIIRNIVKHVLAGLL